MVLSDTLARATDEVHLFASTKTTAGSSPASKSDRVHIVDKALTSASRQFSREFQFLKIGSTK
ncbi:unnamed protein product [Oikopleura dioica]|uniref:Uncharacterized protein n=1 Tax=Oikopleura dioica TaxID=34765 RepID=E4YZ35_OIKDI|nr:unnamed protein product [Oikopleura dioica]